jgi:subtilisin family serine protease
MTGTGNSYAAPHLSGLVALVRSKHRELRPFQVKTVLWAMSANVLEAPPIAGRITRSVLSLSAEDRPHTRRLTLTRPAAATWPAPEVMSRASGLGDPRFAP